MAVKLGKRVLFLVGLNLPEGATVRAAKEYVRQAVRAHAGSLDPEDDPMIDLVAATVTVEEVK